MVVVGEKVTLQLQKAVDEGDKQIDDVIFKDIGWGESAGFHDWLRSPQPNSKILGVRFTPVAPSPNLTHVISINKHCRLSSSNQGLEVFFSLSRDYDPSISDDQSFQYNQMLVSSTGQFVLIIDTEALSASEIESINTGHQ
jgi:hypothetical protein